MLSRSGGGTWNWKAGAAVGDGLTRPQLVLDQTYKSLYLLMSREGGGEIYYKRSPLSSISFSNGRGATFMSWSGAKLNNVSTTKQPVNATTGVVAIAGDKATYTYYHSEMPVIQP